MKKKWLLPFANILCLIHCVGMGIVSATAPLFLAQLHLEWLEYGLLAFNLIVGYQIFKSFKASPIHFRVLATLVGVGFMALWLEAHGIYHIALFFTACWQVFTLVKYHRQSAKHKCCDHEHH